MKEKFARNVPILHVPVQYLSFNYYAFASSLRCFLFIIESSRLYAVWLARSAPSALVLSCSAPSTHISARAVWPRTTAHDRPDKEGKSMHVDYNEALPTTKANYVPLSPLSFLRRSGQVFGHRTSLIQDDRRYTWAETHERCRKLAAALKVWQRKR